MKIIKNKYFHLINDNINIEIKESNSQFNFYIVYYINCLINKNYFDWLKNQIEMIYNYNGIIFIVATLNKKNELKFKKKVLDIYPNVIIECNYKNEFEYPGILKVWQLGQIHNNRNDIILYFHSKGIGHSKNYNNYNIILKDINKIKEIFNLFQIIDKIGYSSGGIGWIWYNFWFVRGSYINMVEKPIKTERRHYYEDWLSRKIENNYFEYENEKPLDYYKNTLLNCYGFYCDKEFGNIGSVYCPEKNRMFLIK